MNRVVRKNGFTLIELMLAMGFVSALLIAIAMTVIQIGNIYNRGLTLKEVNQSGRVIVSELQRSIAASTPFDADPGVGSKYLKEMTNISELKRYVTQDWGGRLCVGQYSYIWNYGEYVYNAVKTNNYSSLNVYSGTNSDVPIRFVKVYDPTAGYCTPTNNLLPDIELSDSSELLDESQHNLVIHYFLVSTTSTSSDTAFDSKTGQRLYNINFLLGTNDWSGDSTLSGSGLDVACKPPNENGSDPSYCSVSQFNIVARAGNAK
jgi:hypothetical protein